MHLRELFDRIAAEQSSATKRDHDGGSVDVPPQEKLGLFRRPGSPYWQWTGRVRGVKIQISLRTAHRPTAVKIARLYRSCLDVLNADFLGFMTDVNPEALAEARPPAVKLAVVLDTYIQSCERLGRRETTLGGYRSHKRLLLHRLGQEVSARALAGPKGVARLREYVTGREAEGVLGRTIRQELRTLRAAWDHGQAVGLIPHKASNPAASKAILPRAEAASETPIFPGAEELDEFRKACEDVELRDFLLCARYTGMRPSEIGRIRWEDIDLEAGILRWENRKAGGAAGVAKVQVRALTREAIVFFRSIEGREVEDRPGAVFLSKDAFRRRWRLWVNGGPGGEKVAERAKFRDIRYMPRSLRHRLNSLLLDAGLPTKRVQAFLGHASESMTHVRYAEAVRSAEELGGLTLAES